MKYLLLGIIQGLTEFLPVSSSGHLVIFQTILKAPYSMAFDIVVHLATALAVIIYFWRDILALFTTKRKMLWLILVAGIFTGIIGLSFKGFFANLYTSVSAVGWFLLLTGVIILIAEKLGKGQRQLKEMNVWDAIIIGLAQGCAIAPGLSRSGTTISAALGRNIDRNTAARFSFLLAAPTILGASLLEAKDIVEASQTGVGLGAMLLGFIGALISGLFAIKIFMVIIQRTSLRVFSYYCFALGGLVLILTLF